MIQLAISIAYILLEYWLGKTKLVKENSMLEFIIQRIFK